VVAHHGGRIQGKGSEIARSSRHKLASLRSVWPQSGVAHLTPGTKKVTFLVKDSANTTNLQTEMKAVWLHLQLLVVVVPVSKSWGDFPVPLQ